MVHVSCCGLLQLYFVEKTSTFLQINSHLLIANVTCFIKFVLISHPWDNDCFDNRVSIVLSLVQPAKISYSSPAYLPSPKYNTDFISVLVLSFWQLYLSEHHEDGNIVSVLSYTRNLSFKALNDTISLIQILIET